MNGYRRDLTDSRAVQVNQGITESALDEILYRPRFPCRALEPTAGAAGPVFANVAAAEYLAFAAGADYRARVAVPLPTAYWTAGTFTVRLLWGGSAVSANVVQWQVNVAPTAVGGAPTNLATIVANTTGVTTVDAVLDYTFTTTVPIVNSSHVLTGVSIGRNGTVDTYPGEARLFGFQLIFTPTAGH